MCSSDLFPSHDTPPVAGYTEMSLADYFGLPTKIGSSATPPPAAFHFRAYNLIYNEWFRDENMINSATVDTGNGPDAAANYVLRRRGKRFDYFTSCLPWPQKGDAVSVPIGTSAPVLGDGTTVTIHNSNDASVKNLNLGLVSGVGTLTSSSAPSSSGVLRWNNTGLYADLSAAIAPSVSDLREAFQIQRAYERDARGGTRYTEIIQAHFGVVSPDSRIQRPEYLGGGVANVNITAIAQTSETGTTPQGNWLLS